MVLDDGAKKRLAELEAKLLVAFNFLKSGECKVQAVDAHKTRHGAAERVMLAYKNKLRLRAADGKSKFCEAPLKSPYVLHFTCLV